MEIQSLAQVAKLSGARFRSVISEEDSMYVPEAPDGFARDLERGGKVEVRLPKSPEWTRVTNPEQLQKMVEDAWTVDCQLAQSLIPGPAGLLLSDSSGEIRRLLLQCPSQGFAETIGPVWNTLATHTDELAKLSIAIPSGSDGERIRARLQQSIERSDKIQFVEVQDGGLLSQWSRDSVLPMADGLLAVPNRRYWAGGSPEGETSDVAVPYLLAEQNGNASVRPIPWISLDGGNVVSNQTTAFVGQHSVDDTAALLKERGLDALEALRSCLGKEVVVLPQATFHVDLSCTPLGEKTMVVADPGLGLELLQSLSPEERSRINEEMGRAAALDGEALIDSYLSDNKSCEAFDEMASKLAAQGYDVVRVPYLAAERNQPVLSYNNVLVDGNQVFLPQYGCEPLDRQARESYERLGYAVVTVPMARISRKMGSLRCSALPTERA